MDITIKVEEQKDKGGKKKLVLWTVYRSTKKGYEHIVAANELPVASSLWDELDTIAKELIELRRLELLKAKKKKK